MAARNPPFYFLKFMPKTSSKKISKVKKQTAKKPSVKSLKKVSSKALPGKLRRRLPLRMSKMSTESSVSSIAEEASQAKFTAFAEPQEISHAVPHELPERYHEDKIVAQVRDPWWLHTYWEVQNSTIQNIERKLGKEFEGARAILRIHDVSLIIFDGKNARSSFDLDVRLETGNWYIDVGQAGRTWCIDIGFLLKNGRFILIARSNIVGTPLDGPSWVTDEEWMVPDELFARLYGMGFGFGPSSPPRKALDKHFKMFTSSPGLFSLSSPVRPKREKNFWLMANTELIVYGATMPDAKVSVQGKPVKLDKEGRFTLRFTLPDGKQLIPIEAWSSSGEDYKSITPIVSKETHAKG